MKSEMGSKKNFVKKITMKDATYFKYLGIDLHKRTILK
jgi:hypothetical protein